MDKPSNFRPPNEREAEGIRQFLKLIAQVQSSMQEKDPEGFQRMMEAARNKGQQR